MLEYLLTLATSQIFKPASRNAICISGSLISGADLPYCNTALDWSASGSEMDVFGTYLFGVVEIAFSVSLDEVAPSLVGIDNVNVCEDVVLFGASLGNVALRKSAT